MLDDNGKEMFSLNLLNLFSGTRLLERVATQGLHLLVCQDLLPCLIGSLSPLSLS